MSYLANPRNTNGTPSILVGLLGPAANTPANSNKLVNSVADQYLLRLGIATKIPEARVISRVRWRSARKASTGTTCSGGRMASGVLATSCTSSRACRTDYKGQSFSFNVPVGLYRNRKPDPYTGAEGDATFPDYVFLGSYSVRFGKGHSKLQGPQPKPVVPSPPVTNN